MKRLFNIAASATGLFILVALVGAFQTRAIPIQTPTRWLDNFADDTGLQNMIDTQVITPTGHLALGRSTINPEQYVTSGLATSVIINPLVAAVPTPARFSVIAPGPGDFVYLMECYEVAGFVDNKFFSYQLSSGQFNEIHTFVENADQSATSLVMGADGLVYIGISNYLYVYNPNSGNLDHLATLGATTLIHKLAAAPSGLIYGIAGLRLFSYNPTTASLSDLGIINSEIDWGRIALTVADDGKVYGGYAANNAGRLFAYDPGTGWIADKGQVLGQQSVNTLVASQNGLIYGGTNTYNGAMGRFFAYNPVNDSFVDLAGSYGGVYALARGQDNLIYGAARMNGWETYLFIYNPTSNILEETGRIKGGSGHVSNLIWASDGRVYGTQVEGRYNLVVYDPVNSEFNAWDQVTFDYIAPAGTTVRIDILDAQDNTLLTDVKSGDSLSSINPVVHQALQLRANLIGNGTDTPLLDSWSVHIIPSWTPSTISGQVADSDHVPIAGVTISARAGYTAVTDGNGAYILDDLAPGAYTLIPSKAGCLFTPSTRTVSVPPDATGQGFEAHCDFDIFGQVLDGSFNPIAGVQILAGAGRSTNTDADGQYTLTQLLSGTHTLTPTLAGYTFRPATRVVTLPPDATGQDFIILPGPVSVTLPLSGTANMPTHLIYTDTQGLTTTLDFPAGAVTETTMVVLSPTLPQGNGDSTSGNHIIEIAARGEKHALPWGDSGFAFAGHAFEIAAFRDNHPLADLAFNQPVTVTIHYNSQDVRLVSDKSQLALGWWTGGRWEDAADTCASPLTFTRNLAKQVVSVPICRLGLFSLFGPTHPIYLPLVLQSQ